jgi:hypothetical protein
MLIGLEIAKPRWGTWGSSGGSVSGRSSSGGSSAGSVNGTSGGGRGLDAKAVDEHVALWMREFDRQGTGHITEEMFHEGGRRFRGLRAGGLARSDRASVLA